jgi:exopolysaccharide biosynthesis polyprenyl glycosylphosphotransferase
VRILAPRRPTLTDADHDLRAMSSAPDALDPSGAATIPIAHTAPGYRVAKRALDLTAAAIGLVLTSPLMLGIAAAVKAESPGPVFFRQQRLGLGGRPFTILKFRSMHLRADEREHRVHISRLIRQDKPASDDVTWLPIEADARVTRVGALLRRSHLDELPQLLNIVRGDMSLVGPRPERPEFVASLQRTIAFYGQRHTVRPGLTGWAQVRYSYGATVEDAMEKLQYDLFYIKNMSLALDLFIIANTVKTVLMGRGAQ